jgi:hypothetical protein
MEDSDMHVLSRVFVVIGIIGSVALPAEAADGPRADIALGYSLIYDHDIKTTFPAGWFAGAAVNVTNAFALAGEVSGNYKSESTTIGSTTANATLNVYSYLGGPRLVTGTGAARVFFEILAGGATVSGGVSTITARSAFLSNASQTDFCYRPGAGIDIGFNPRIALRLAAGERFIRVNGGTSNEFQFVGGLVFRFDK